MQREGERRVEEEGERGRGGDGRVKSCEERRRTEEEGEERKTGGGSGVRGSR